MKQVWNKARIFSIILLASLPIQIIGQALEIPRASPKASVSQLIGVCDVIIHYGRPSVRERVIFGGLVPFDQVWRAGANEATTISFNHDVIFGGKEISSGQYGLFIIPQKDQWVVILNRTSEQWGAYLYDKNEDVARIEVSPQRIAEEEMCTYTFTAVTKSGGVLNMDWENTRIAIPIETDSHLQTLEEIDRAVGTTQAHWYTYSAAAQYHFYDRQDAEQALKYIDVAIALEAPNPAPWMLKSQILASLGRYEEAIIEAKEAIKVCRKHNFPFEVHENETQIRKWQDK